MTKITVHDLEKEGWQRVNACYDYKDGFSMWSYGKWFLEKGAATTATAATILLNDVQSMEEMNEAIKQHKLSLKKFIGVIPHVSDIALQIDYSQDKLKTKQP